MVIVGLIVAEVTDEMLKYMWERQITMPSTLIWSPFAPHTTFATATATTLLASTVAM